MLRRFVTLSVAGRLALLIALLASSHVLAFEQSDIPAWLGAHVGTSDDQIAPVVLRRARSLYLQKRSEGAVNNRCYFAMDATRPNSSRRFYVICESERSFRAVRAGHGGGLDLRGVADFANGRECAKNFGNAMGSDLTAGGAYVTRETKTSFKGYYRGSENRRAILMRSFVQFDGEGQTANARQREIGGHATVKLAGICLLKDAGSPHANPQGYVPFGTLVDYSGGRSNGCTSWSPSDASQIIAMVRDNPTTLYIYPDANDIHAVAGSRFASYWNASCLRQIGAPRFWSEDALGPMIARYRESHPPPPPRPIPICRGQ